MLGYISSTRKKSCQACVKAKRRCDLGYPICPRCFTKGLHCKYPNASVRDAEIIVRQTTPDLLPVVDVLAGSSESPQVDANLVPTSLPHSSDSSSDSDTTQLEDRYDPLLESVLNEIWAPAIMSEARMSAVVHELCNFIPSMAYSGRTVFMHDALYNNYQPAAYQDSCSLSALYMVKTSKNAPILVNSINAKINSLISSSSTWTLTEHLAAVQALIIYQIIRLFDPSLNAQPLAEKQNGLLELWAATLWKRSFNELNSFPECYDSWVFHESLRRTVLLSVFVRGAWGALTKGGLCEQVHVLQRLPLTRDTKLWDCGYEEWVKRTPCEKENGCLVPYGEFSIAWKPSTSMDQLTDFERLLLAACRGDDDPRLLRIEI